MPSPTCTKRFSILGILLISANTDALASYMRNPLVDNEYPLYCATSCNETITDNKKPTSFFTGKKLQINYSINPYCP